MLDKAPRLSISIVIWILSSDTICQLNQFNTNSEVAMLSRFSHYLKLMTLWGTHSTGRPNDNNGNKNTNNNNNNISDQHSRDPTFCWTKGTCRVDGWIRENLAFWQFLFSTCLALFEVPLFSSAFWGLEIVSAIARRDTRLEEYPK